MTPDTEEYLMYENSIVLIVDDDEFSLLLLKQLFNKAGIQAICATSGEEALKELAAHSFSCMITDFNMPHMNGIELAKKAKILAPRMLIALCTGEDFSGDRWDAIKEDVVAVFTKPVNYYDMLARLIDNIRNMDRAFSDESPEEPRRVCQQLSN